MLVSNQWIFHKKETAEKNEQQEINSMKKQLTGFLLSVMLLSMCVGCGAESTTTEPTETAEAITTQESISEQTEEATGASAETEEQSPEATEEPGEVVATETEKAEVTPEATTEPAETAEPAQAETPAAEPASQYTYTDMTATMYAQQTVNVRDLPDTNGNKVGSLSTNEEMTITGKCNETSWYRFEYNGSVAYVSDKYVGKNKVEAVQESANKADSPASKHWYDGYEMYTWYDMGSYFFFLVPPTTSLQENTGYLNAADSDIRPKLEERYPGKSAVSVGGWGAAWTNEIHTLVYDAVYIVDGVPQWEYGTHIWE